MKRQSVNFVHYLLEEWIPRALRDSAPMRWLFRLFWGRFIDDLETFRANIRHVTAKRLLVIVPLEREYRLTFKPRVHFFPCPHSFLRHIVPVPSKARWEIIGRDLQHIEDQDRPA